MSDPNKSTDPEIVRLLNEKAAFRCAIIDLRQGLMTAVTSERYLPYQQRELFALLNKLEDATDEHTLSKLRST